MAVHMQKGEAATALDLKASNNTEFKCKMKVFSVCLRAKANYTCPKCLAPYCSLSCYQAPKHEDCSERFYEKNVLQELQSQTADDEEKKAMLDMLKQFEEECNADEQEMLREEERAQLAVRMEGIDLDGDPQKIWVNLTKAERDAFTSILKENKFSELVQEWLPWWTYKRKPQPLVQEVTTEQEQDDEDLSEYNFPDINTAIQSFSKLSCAEDLVSLSAVLLKAENFNSTSESLRANHSSCQQLDDLYISLEYFNETVNNTVLIIQGPYEHPSDDYLLMAFSDMLQLIDGATKELKKEVDSKEARRKLQLMRKKLEYYSSYSLTHGVEQLAPLVPDILNAIATLKEDKDFLAKNKTKGLKANSTESKKKIEVIN